MSSNLKNVSNDIYVFKNWEKYYLNEKCVKQKKLLKTAGTTKNWGNKLIVWLKQYLGVEAYNAQVSVQTHCSTINMTYSEYKKSVPSFAQWLIKLKSHLSPFIAPNAVPSCGSKQQLASCLNYSQTDTVHSKKEAYYLTDEVMLISESTPVFLKHGKQGFTIKNVYRIDSRDSTHSNQFLQLEYREAVCKDSVPNYLNALIERLLNICQILGLNTCNIQFRPTRYSYVAPAIEVFYKTSENKLVELFGAGILTETVLKNTHPNYDPNKIYFAAGIGLERTYTVVHDIRSIHECQR